MKRPTVVTSPLPGSAHTPSLHRPFTRRDFLRTSATASAATAASIWLPNVAGAQQSHAQHARTTPGRGPDIVVPRTGRWNDPDLHALAAHAIDAAMAAGASYADVRLSLSRDEQWSNPYPTRPYTQVENHDVGVRVLVNGFWGFLGSSVWTPEEMVRLAQGAVTQAKGISLGKTRDTPLSPAPVVSKGEWVMPVKYDPFDITYAEKYDFMNEVEGLFKSACPWATGGLQAHFSRMHKVFASSEGSSLAQTTYLTEGQFAVTYVDQPGYHIINPGQDASTHITAAGKGWEYISENGLLDEIPAMIDFARENRNRIPINVGRYDIVCAPIVMADLVSETIGAATELDRALGYEANEGGTSYLDQPLEMLGNYKMGSPLLNVTANRSHPGGVATVKWDDEGVVPDEFSIVKDGILVDYQTTREQAMWLAPYYQKAGIPVHSHGCSACSSALNTPMQQDPNYQLMPGTKDVTFDDMVADTEDGIAIYQAGQALMDQQKLNGYIMGVMREIKKGKLGRFIFGGAMEFRAPELWKSLAAIGGPKTTQWVGIQTSKGNPIQSMHHSVGAVPGKFTNAPVIDAYRKA